jgi:hypothetical protein
MFCLPSDHNLISFDPADPNRFRLPWIFGFTPFIAVSLAVSLALNFLSFSLTLRQFAEKNASIGRFVLWIWATSLIITDVTILVNNGWLTRYDYMFIWVHFVCEFLLGVVLCLMASDRILPGGYTWKVSEMLKRMGEMEQAFFIHGVSFVLYALALIGVMNYVLSSADMLQKFTLVGTLTDPFLGISSLVLLVAKRGPFEAFTVGAVIGHVMVVISVLISCSSEPLIGSSLHYAGVILTQLCTVLAMRF